MNEATFSAPGSGSPLDESERIEQAAWTELCTSPEARRLGLEVDSPGSAVVLRAPAIAHILFNRVIGFGVDPHPEQTLRAIQASYLEAHVNQYLVHVAPGASAESRATLRRSLRRHPRSWVKLGRGPNPVIASPTECSVRPASADDHEAFARVMRVGFGLPALADELWKGLLEKPRWSCFVAEHSARVVAAAAMYIDDGAAYLAGAATLPAYRGRGAQSALLEQRLRSALSEGCRAIYSETGEAVAGEPNTSEENMRRAGLKPLYVRENFAPL